MLDADPGPGSQSFEVIRTGSQLQYPVAIDNGEPAFTEFFLDLLGVIFVRHLISSAAVEANESKLRLPASFVRH